MRFLPIIKNLHTKYNKYFFKTKYNANLVKEKKLDNKKRNVAELVDSIIDFININKLDKISNNNTKILEVACGEGKLFADPIQKKGYKVYAIDIDKKITDLGKKFFPDINFSYGDAENIPFPDNYFDFVYCFNSTQFFPNIKDAFDEMLRVVKKKGWLISDIPNYENIIASENNDPEFFNNEINKTNVFERIYYLISWPVRLIKFFLPLMMKSLFIKYKTKDLYLSFNRILFSYNIHRPWRRSYKTNEIIELSNNLKLVSKINIKGFDKQFINLERYDLKYHLNYFFCNKL